MSRGARRLILCGCLVITGAACSSPDPLAVDGDFAAPDDFSRDGDGGGESDTVPGRPRMLPVAPSGGVGGFGGAKGENPGGAGGADAQ